MELSREVGIKVIRSFPKMVGTTERTVQIDEYYFEGRRKYNRGRILDGAREHNRI